MKKVLYVIANPFAYQRRSIGGNISSGVGVITSFVRCGYQVDILSDSEVPSLDGGCTGINTLFYPWQRIRSILRSSYKGILGRAAAKLENFVFQRVMKSVVDHCLRKGEYEFCYVRASFNAHAIADVVKKRGVKLIVEVNKPLSMGPFNNDDVLNWPNENEKVFVPRSESIQYDAATVITVDSSIRARWVTDFVGAHYKRKMLINHNGVDTDMFTPNLKSQDLRYSLGYTKDDVVVGMASSFRWYNDVGELCQIIDQVYDKDDRIKFLIIIGDPKKAEQIQARVDRVGLSHSVLIRTEIPFLDMPRLTHVCDIGISHFNFHGKWPHNCSIKHLECLALAKPIVATDVGEVNFAVEDGVNGFLCQEGDVGQFADAIVRLAADSELRERFGRNGRHKALTELTWEKNVEKILNFQKSL